MQNIDNAPLRQEIEQFRGDYAASFRGLMDALNEAQLSHYSSALGTKRITYEIFPAADYVAELMRMLSLDRTFVSRPVCGLRDAVPQMGMNPAYDFILYLKRWSGFAEQVMKGEGDNARGIAAARAKLIMDDLAARLNEGKMANGKNALPVTRFSRLMEAIATTILGRENNDAEQRKAKIQQDNQRNYSKALAAAQGSLYQEPSAFAAQSKAA